jgi:histone chaperone ASF1
MFYLNTGKKVLCTMCFFLDLEWKMIYVGSAESEEHDQILDTIYVGPIPEGKHKFVFQV